MRLSCTFLLGLFFSGLLFALTPALTCAEGSWLDYPQKEKPAWAIPSHADPKSKFNREKYEEECPAEWEFLGYTAKELHDRFDEMSPCESQLARFWFHGCGGIDGGTFIEVKYGADEKVAEAWCCYTGCTYTHYGKHFSDKDEAIKFAITRCTKNLQEHIEQKKTIPLNLVRQLKSRAKAYNALGNTKLETLDLKSIERIRPVMARYNSAGSSCAINAPVVKLSKEFERNGFKVQKLSARKYKYYKPNGPSYVVTANSRQIVNTEQAIWFLHEEIEKEAVKVFHAASLSTPI